MRALKVRGSSPLHQLMDVGLPLLAHLTTAEPAAVIAHEFGHYVSGDVGLGP
jgi:hypothetical protein